MTSDIFPIGLRLSGRRVLVVGSGPETDARVTALLDAGAVPSVVCERPSDALTALAARGAVELWQRAFDERDLDGVWLAVSTDLDAAAAARIHRAASLRQVFFCAVDQPDFCTFSHLALARVAGVTLAVSTNGRAPALARRLRQELERLLADSPLGPFIDSIAALRERTPSAERRAVLGQAVAGVRLTGRLELPGSPEGDDGPVATP